MPPAGSGYSTAIPRPPRLLAALLSAPLLACSLTDLSSYSQGGSAAGAAGAAGSGGKAGAAGSGAGGNASGAAGQGGNAPGGGGPGGGGQGGQAGGGQAGGGQGGALPCATEKDCPAAPCQKRACTSNKCSYAAEAAGTPCDDGLKCTTNDRCEGNQCKGTPIACESSCTNSKEIRRACVEPTGECKEEPETPCALGCKDGKVRQPFCNASKTGCDEKPCDQVCSGNIASTGKCAGDGLLCEFSDCPGNLLCKDTSQCHASCPGAGADVCATGYECKAAGQPCEPAGPMPGK